MDDRTKRKMDIQTEFLPILQDFIPYRGRCPAQMKHFKMFNCKKIITRKYSLSVSAFLSFHLQTFVKYLFAILSENL